MGIEVEAKLVHVPVEAGSEQNNLLKENGKLNHGSGITEPIKFGSHGTEEPKKEEVSRIPASNVPKDAVEDWPEPKQIHRLKACSTAFSMKAFLSERRECHNFPI